jgi:hypothetical protein
VIGGGYRLQCCHIVEGGNVNCFPIVHMLKSFAYAGG